LWGGVAGAHSASGRVKRGEERQRIPKPPAASWLFEHVRDGLLLVDGTSRQVTGANPAARALFGWQPGEEPDRELEELVAEASRAVVRDAIDASLRRGPRAGRTLEVAVLGPASEEIPTELVLDRLPERPGDRITLLVSLRDLRERARSTARREALLRVARLAAQSDAGQLFEALLAEAVAVLHADDGGIAHWDAQHGLLRQAHTFLSSASAGTVLDPDRSASGRAASQQRPVIINDYQRQIGTATPAGRTGAQAVVAAPLVYEGRLLGTLSVSRLRPAHPFVLSDAEILELLASTASATLVGLERARQLLETVGQLQAAKEAAEAADRAKSLFLATMSHELRTPLTAILGYAELLLEEVAARDQSALVPDLERIRTAGRELLALIDSVLDLTAIESGALRLSPERLAMAPLVEDVVAAVRPLVDKQGNTLTVAYGLDLGEIWADRTRVRQALLSLLSNASKFTERGTLSLHVARERADGQEWLSMRISDTGIGMTPEQLSWAAAPFWQADPSTTRRHSGAGLGLALTQRLCALMGGALLAESEPGVGTVFTVRLPTEPAP
jgi:PAS domain S-box-containing protein